jgi:lipopolysaccharide/colanic/teichoic acid biosynthesis glycosyltransferase
MILRKWEDLPDNIRNEAVRPYYDSLQKKQISLACKFIFDRVMALLMLICLSPVFLILAILIKTR